MVRFQGYFYDSISEADGSLCKKEDRGVTLEALKDMLTDIISKKDKVEKDYLDEENNGKQVRGF